MVKKGKKAWMVGKGSLLCLQHRHALGGVKSICCIVCGTGILERGISFRECAYNAEIFVHK